jgi:hypothetical protein
MLELISKPKIYQLETPGKVPSEKRQYKDTNGFLAPKSLKFRRTFIQKRPNARPATLKTSPKLAHKSIKMHFFWIFLAFSHLTIKTITY